MNILLYIAATIFFIKSTLLGLMHLFEGASSAPGHLNLIIGLLLLVLATLRERGAA